MIVEPTKQQTMSPVSDQSTEQQKESLPFKKLICLKSFSSSSGLKFFVAILGDEMYLLSAIAPGLPDDLKGETPQYSRSCSVVHAR